jgi:hypothetical protein
MLSELIDLIIADTANANMNEFVKTLDLFDAKEKWDIVGGWPIDK